jgi:hypothetical protein
MPDPVLLAIAAAVAAKSAEAMIEGGRNAAATLTRLVRERLRRDNREGVLDAAVARPDDEVRRARLAGVLAELAACDPSFGERLRECWAAASTGPGAVVNRFSGSAAGPVVQARDIRGDISF